MIGVSNHLLSIVSRFHYHSQKVIGFLGNMFAFFFSGGAWLVLVFFFCGGEGVSSLNFAHLMQVLRRLFGERKGKEHDEHEGKQQKQISGQIIIFHQPRFP